MLNNDFVKSNVQLKVNTSSSSLLLLLLLLDGVKVSLFPQKWYPVFEMTLS